MRHAEGEERRSKDHRYSLNNSDFSDIDDEEDLDDVKKQVLAYNGMLVGLEMFDLPTADLFV